jgi:hypothetical protein
MLALKTLRMVGIVMMMTVDKQIDGCVDDNRKADGRCFSFHVKNIEMRVP